MVTIILSLSTKEVFFLDCRERGKKMKNGRIILIASIYFNSTALDYRYYSPFYR